MVFNQSSTQNTAPAAVSAAVTRCEGGYVCASGEGEHRDMPVFSPAGVCTAPCEGDEALLLPLDGGSAYIGALCPPAVLAGLLPGEVKLFSRGGAYIVLKNNGDAVINGLVVKPDGSFWGVSGRSKG